MSKLFSKSEDLSTIPAGDANAHKTPPSGLKEGFQVNARIKGKVQGVYYRKWTLENALKLGLKGWVRNRKDGSVEALFSGPQNVVDGMLQKCKSGPSAARVSDIEMSTWSGQVPAGFERRTTL